MASLLLQSCCLRRSPQDQCSGFSGSVVPPPGHRLQQPRRTPGGDLPDWAAQPREPAGPSGAAWPGPASCSEAGPHLTLGAGLFFLQNGSPAGAAERTAPSLECDRSSANGSVMIGEPQPGAESPPPLTGHPKTWIAPKPRGAQHLPCCRRATGAARRACPPHGSPLGNLTVSLKRRAAQGGMGDRCTPGPR